MVWGQDGRTQLRICPETMSGQTCWPLAEKPLAVHDFFTRSCWSSPLVIKLGSLEIHAFRAQFDVFLVLDAIRCPCIMYGRFQSHAWCHRTKIWAHSCRLDSSWLVSRCLDFLLGAGLHVMMISARKYICFSWLRADNLHQESAFSHRFDAINFYRKAS